ncbi:hypothetical protein B0H10DRAFT_1951040 [Mycena sp. CBHHK59/15]|nr:hypothetical protein B0H10DRAFT_1951040 [Mycena sp. CBHHK59/15]
MHGVSAPTTTAMRVRPNITWFLGTDGDIIFEQPSTQTASRRIASGHRFFGSSEYTGWASCTNGQPRVEEISTNQDEFRKLRRPQKSPRVQDNVVIVADQILQAEGGSDDLSPLNVPVDTGVMRRIKSPQCPETGSISPTSPDVLALEFCLSCESLLVTQSWQIGRDGPAIGRPDAAEATQGLVMIA